jgi:hypothetical protein
VAEADNVPQLTACVPLGGCGCAGSSYPEFIQSVHLPAQLAEVDPIVASFCGGAVGVVSALLVVEVRLLPICFRARMLLQPCMDTKWPCGIPMRMQAPIQPPTLLPT